MPAEPPTLPSLPPSEPVATVAKVKLSQVPAANACPDPCCLWDR